MTAHALSVADRDRAIWEARRAGETVAELGARFDLRQEKITLICVREQTLEQRRCEAFRCRRTVHEPPCPLADPIELALASLQVGEEQT